MTTGDKRMPSTAGKPSMMSFSSIVSATSPTAGAVSADARKTPAAVVKPGPPAPATDAGASAVAGRPSAGSSNGQAPKKFISGSKRADGSAPPSEPAERGGSSKQAEKTEHPKQAVTRPAPVAASEAIPTTTPATAASTAPAIAVSIASVTAVSIAPVTAVSTAPATAVSTASAAAPPPTSAAAVETGSFEYGRRAAPVYATPYPSYQYQPHHYGYGAPMHPMFFAPPPMNAPFIPPQKHAADAPPGIPAAASNAVVGTPLFVPAKKSSAIKIVNPDTGASIDLKKAVSVAAAPAPVVTTSTETAKKPVVLKTPSGQELDLPHTKKDATAHEVASLESALASLSISPAEKPELEDGELESASDYTSASDMSEEEEHAADYLLQRGQRLVYPSGIIPPSAIPEAATDPWKYTTAFLMQFQRLCTATNQALRNTIQDRFKQGASRRSRHSNAGHKTSSRRERIQLNRTDNAWQPSGATVENPIEKAIRELRGILNKLTMEKFDLLSDEILALGILDAVSAQVLLPEVISCLFNKAVDEPQFCPMYAKLCFKIVSEESARRKAEQRASGLPERHESEFRRLLVTRCQGEYENKRAWSKQRIEKVRAKMEGREAAEVHVDKRATEDIGHLTEEDLSMIKLKRHVLGNIRFIGELFKAGLLSAKIMHACVAELLSNVENPEEEEIESLCRLLTTVGKLIDQPPYPDSVSPFPTYVAKMKYLASAKSGLPSRARFMVMDVLELREGKWMSAAERTSTHQRREDQRERERRAVQGPPQYRDGRRDDRPDSRPDSRRSGSDRAAERGGPRKTFATGGNREPAWSTTASAGVAAKPRPTQILPRPPSTGTASEASPVVNRFGALVQEDPKRGAALSDRQPPAADERTQRDRIRKFIAIADEYFRLNNMADLVEEARTVDAAFHGQMLASLMSHAMEKGRKELFALRPVVAALCASVVSVDSAAEALASTFDLLDDLVVDIPAACEYAGYMMAAFVDCTGSWSAVTTAGVSPDLMARDPLTAIKALGWLLAYASSPRNAACTERLFRAVDATPESVEALKRILRDRLSTVLPELSLKSFDDGIRALHKSDSEALLPSLVSLVAAAAKDNMAHFPLILTRVFASIFERRRFDLLPSIRTQILDALLPPSAPVDAQTARSILAMISAEDAEPVARSLHSLRIVSDDAVAAWRPVAPPALHAWIDSLPSGGN